MARLKEINKVREVEQGPQRLHATDKLDFAGLFGQIINLTKKQPRKHLWEWLSVPRVATKYYLNCSVFHKKLQDMKADRTM